jgi:hypothetical protein
VAVVNIADLLHALRTVELTRLPPGARTVLSGGAASALYFEWFASAYPTPVERHIGVEAYAPRPAGLADTIEWLPRTLGDLDPVGDGSVDLVFAGQVIEHLWPDEIVSFLLHSHRVLAPGATLAVDSVNRRLTMALDWVHPDHTVEFTTHEIIELLELAGFADVAVRGVWLCYDRDRHRLLPWALPDLEDAPREWRGGAAEDRPEDSLIWWAEARRADRAPSPEALRARVEAIAYRFRHAAMGQLYPGDAGAQQYPVPGERIAASAQGRPGYLVDGPRRPLPPGPWRARYRVGCRLSPGEQRRYGPRHPIGSVDVAVGDEDAARVLLHRDVLLGDVGVDGRLREVALAFELAETTMGMRFRVHSSGEFPMRARLRVDVDRADVNAAGAPPRWAWRRRTIWGRHLRATIGPRALARRLGIRRPRWRRTAPGV